MDPKLIKRIDNMYRNMKPIVVMAFVGVLMPPILLFAAPLGLLYALQRIRLIDDIADASAPEDPALANKVAYIHEHNMRLFVPLIVMVVGLILLTAFVLISIAIAE